MVMSVCPMYAQATAPVTARAPPTSGVGRMAGMGAQPPQQLATVGGGRLQLRLSGRQATAALRRRHLAVVGPALLGLSARASTETPYSKPEGKGTGEKPKPVGAPGLAGMDLPETFTPPPTRVTAPGRIIAIGDLHGDLVQTMRVLQLAGLMAPPVMGEPAQWTGGNSTLVQMGDILDRGDDEIGILRLLWQLGEGAEKEGGAVYILNGNHETLNVSGDFRYVTPAAFRESSIVALGTADFGSPGVSFTMQARARLALFSPGAPLARKLAQHPTVLIVNDTVFAHGGLLPQHVQYGLEQINEDVSKWMLGGAEPPESLVYTPDSVVWNRMYSRDHNFAQEQAAACSTLRDTLELVGAKRLVVGHTPQMQGCNCECERQVWRVDVGMSVGVMGAPVQALEILPKPENGEKADEIFGDGSEEAADDVIINILQF